MCNVSFTRDLCSRNIIFGSFCILCVFYLAMLESSPMMYVFIDASCMVELFSLMSCNRFIKVGCIL